MPRVLLYGKVSCLLLLAVPSISLSYVNRRLFFRGLGSVTAAGVAGCGRVVASEEEGEEGKGDLLYSPNANPSEAAPLRRPPSRPLSSLCKSESDPFKTTKHCVRFGRDKDNRLLTVAADENGISTSAVRSPSKFSAPWDYVPETFEADVAWKSLKIAITELEGARIVEEKMEPQVSFYLHATAPSSVPPGSIDDIEFVLNTDTKVVFFRSVTRDTVFLYPLQQPLSDRGANLKRLESIRKSLGWSRLSYEFGDAVSY